LGATNGEKPEVTARLVNQARQLIRQSNFAGARQLLQPELDRAILDRRHTEALYTLAVAQRYESRYSDALATLKKLFTVNPTYGRGHQEKGYALKAMGKEGEACSAFERAVQTNPALHASWKELSEFYSKAGLDGQKQLALDRFNYLAGLPRELLTVSSMIHEGKLYKADRLCRHFLREHKHHVEGMRLLAAIGTELGILNDAEFLLESCLEFDPNHRHARYDYANLLLRMQKFEKAYKQTRILVENQPDNLAYRALLANAAAGIGCHDEAIDEYNKVLKKSTGQHQLIVMRGHAEKTIGDLTAAIRSYKSAFSMKPDYGDAFWSLANTKNYRFMAKEIDHMIRYEALEDTSQEDRIHLCFALGKALEDRGEYAGSMDYYLSGNELKRNTIQHQPSMLNIRSKSQTEVFTAEFFENKKGVGCSAPDPIFIVGLPRAGSTLLEQILASHSSVTGTYELPNIIALVQRLRGTQVADKENNAPKYPQILTELEDDYFFRFGEQYIDETRIYRQGSEYFIDKNPNNFFHIGLIRLILPNAKIIDARRHPMSCCFSGFKQLFGQGQEFTYGLEQIGNYYREYVELMDHWNRVLPGFVLPVNYEEVVNDLETQVRRILGFCGLPFEDACLEFHRTRRSVRTPSSEQVRQPIYRSGMDYWRHYDRWLDPLRNALGVYIRERYGIETGADR